MSEERKALERLIFRLVAGALGLVAAVILLPVAWNTLSPFVIAVPLAAMLQPTISILKRRLKMKSGPAVLLPVLIICVMAILLLYWLISFGVTQLLTVANNSGMLINELIVTLKTAFEKLLGAAEHMPETIADWLRNAFNDGLNWIYEQATALVGQVVSKTISLASGIPYAMVYANFLILGLYFIALNYENIRARLPGGKRHDPNSNTTQLTNSAIAGLLGYLRVQGTFALLSLVVSWIVLQCFGFSYAYLLAMLAAVLEFLPLFGNGTLYVPWAIVSYILGDAYTGTILLVLTYGLLLIRRITEPKLLSNSIGVSPLQSLIGMFAGMRVGGVLGLVAGPVVMVVVVNALRGSYFDSIKRDAKILIQYFRRRWATEEPQESTGKTTG